MPARPSAASSARRVHPGPTEYGPRSTIVLAELHPPQPYSPGLTHTGGTLPRSPPFAAGDSILTGTPTPLAVSLTGGNRHDVTQLLPLLDAISSIRGLRGRPRRNPRRLYADRGYDFDKYRRLLRKRGIKPLIVRRCVAHGSGLGKARWVVERAFAWLHQFKRLRTRYERRADLHQGMLKLACSLICLHRLRASIRKDQ